MLADLKSEKGTQHVKTGMCQIKNPHHTEDDGQSTGHKKQQHPVKDAVDS